MTNESPRKDRKSYETPNITSYSAAEITKLIGPAVANYGGTGTNP